MKKLKLIILSLITIFITDFAYSVDPTYTLTLSFPININSNTIEFDIYLKHTNPSQTNFYYSMGQYVLYIPATSTQGGNLTYTFSPLPNASDLPVELRPLNPTVYINSNSIQLRLAPNIPPASYPGQSNPVFSIASTGSGTKIARMRLQTTAARFEYLHHLIWKNSGEYFTKIVCNNFSATQSLVKNITNPTYHTPSYNNASNHIFGKVFLDYNSNGVQDLGEPGYNYFNTEVRNVGNVVIGSGGGRVNGYYCTHIGVSGNYTIKINGFPASYICNPPIHTVDFAGLGYVDDFNDFALTTIQNVSDVKVSLTGFTQRPGFTVQKYLTYQNAGTGSKTDRIEMFHDSRLTFLSSDFPYTYNSLTKKITWNYSNLDPGQSRIIKMSFSSLPSLPLGTVLSSTATIYPISGDALPLDNEFRYNEIVKGSFDPNDISVEPQGNISPQQVTNEDSLTYTIRFQNTGTDTAFTVRILDSLSSNLNPESMEIISSSHDYSYEIDENGVAEFTFNYILLPDSTTNEPESHGFIKYSIKPKNTLVIGDTISNTAHIYFDFNEPVVTNTVTTPVQNIPGNDVGTIANAEPTYDQSYCPEKTIAPKATIKNFGSSDQDSPFNITYNITGPVNYTSTKSTTLSAGTTKTITFDSTFIPNLGGNYNVEIYTTLVSDDNTVNDTIASSFNVINPNYGGGLVSNSNYFFANSTSCSNGAANKPVFSWEDTAQSQSLIVNGVDVSGGLLHGNLDDGYFSIGSILALSDKFRFCGVDYDSFFVSTNGMIGLTAADNDAALKSNSPSGIPFTENARTCVFPLWMDLDFADADVLVNRLSYKVVSDANKVIITYDRAPRANAGTEPDDYVSFQVILETALGPTQDGNIVVQYDNLKTGPAFLTNYYEGTLAANLVGFQDQTGTKGIQYRFLPQGFGPASIGPLFGSQLAVAFGTDQNALPVELISFTSATNRRDVTLNWTTASEINNSGFAVERLDLRGETQDVWKSVGIVTGSGNSNTLQNYSYNDKNLSSGKYKYRLKQTDINGNFIYHQLSNEVQIGVPEKFDLSQNYPNPFNPSTKINYDLPFDSKVTIILFDVSGREVVSLVKDIKTAGYYTINFNASNLASGIYFCRMSAEGNGKNFLATKKLMLLK